MPKKRKYKIEKTPEGIVIIDAKTAGILIDASMIETTNAFSIVKKSYTVGGCKVKNEDGIEERARKATNHRRFFVTRHYRKQRSQQWLNRIKTYRF